MEENKYEHLNKKQLINLLINLRKENKMLHNARAKALKEAEEAEKQFEKKLKELIDNL